MLTTLDENDENTNDMQVRQKQWAQRILIINKDVN